MIGFWTGSAEIAAAVILLCLLGSWRVFAKANQNKSPCLATHPAGVDANHTDAPHADAPYGDVATAARTALNRLAPWIARNLMRVDFAVTPGLQTRLQQALLADVIHDLLSLVIRAAPASHVLLTSSRQGDQIEIAVSDDAPEADEAFRSGQAHGLSDRIALLGGALHMTSHAGKGSTIVVQLFAAPELPGAASAEHPGPRAEVVTITG